MKITSNKGFTGVEIAAAIVILFCTLFVTKKVLDTHGSGPTKNEVALGEQKSAAAKDGQQFAAATTKEIAKAKDQSDPAIVAASKTAARADLALNTGLGALTPAQSQWVQNLVEANDAAFNVALSSKDKELAETGDKITALQKAVANERERSDWFKNLLIGAAVLFIFINFVLPWLETMFPALGAFVGAVHAVANPFLASLKTKAEAALTAADAKMRTLYSEVGTAVTDMRAKLGGAAPAAIAHLDANLSNENIDAVAAAARTAAAQSAAAKAAAEQAVQIASA